MTALPDMLRAEWPAPRRIHAWVTTRNGGHSGAAFGGADGSGGLNLSLDSGDERESVLRNRARLLDIGAPPPFWLRQVHGAAVVEARPGDAATLVQADASVARCSGVACIVMVADCLPVLLCDDAGSVIGAAHAGWRGLAAGVLESTVAAMGGAPQSLMAFLGPAIGPQRFEVGPEVRDAFMDSDVRAASAFSEAPGAKFLADLYELARQRLASAGVTRVYGGGRCTMSEADTFYSYRRERTTGRMGALIWIGHDESNAPPTRAKPR